MITPADAKSDKKAGFPETQPDLIKRVGDGPDPSSPSWRDVAATFCAAYCPPLTGYITKKMVAAGFPPYLSNRAKEYVSDFLNMVIESPRLCREWDKSKGRFRNWIATPCWWYVQTIQRKESPGRHSAAKPEDSRQGDEGKKQKGPFRRIESLNRVGAPDVADEAAERDLAERDDALDLATELDLGEQADELLLARGRTWLFMLWIRAIALWHSRYGDWRRWRLFAKLVLVPYRTKQPPPQIKDSQPQSDDSEPQIRDAQPQSDDSEPPIVGLYRDCGYDNAGQAYRARKRFAEQFAECIREVLREVLLEKEASRGAGWTSGDDRDLAQRIEAAYEQYLKLLDREIKLRYDYTLDWKEAEWDAAGDAVERFLQQISGTVVQATPGDSSLPTDARPAAPPDEFGDVPDLDACTLGVIAAVLTQTRHDPTAKELEADLRELLSLPWTSVVGQTADAVGAAESVGAVILAEEPRTEAWWKIKEAAKAARKAADGDVWEDAWSAIYYASIAAEIAAKRCLLDKPFTDLSPERQVDGLRWLARRLWVEPKICNLAARALEQIGEKA